MSCPSLVDSSFGPWAGRNCRNGLDFTFLFELIFFSFIPAAVFIIAVLCDGLFPSQQQRPQLRKLGGLRVYKLVAIAALGALAIVNLTLMSIQEIPVHRFAIATSALECLAILILGRASILRHALLPRPSLLITLYLSVSVILSLPTARTLWLLPGVSATAASYTVFVLGKATCLLLENIEKKNLLIDPARYSPEERAGPLNRLCFGWLFPLLIKGYGTILSIPRLTPLSADLKSDELAEKLDKIFEQTEPGSLVRQLFFNLWQACLLPVIPRVFLLGFTLAQPFLIYTTVNYISISSEDRDEVQGRFLIFAFVLVFVGFALANAFYWHLVNRLEIKVRGSLLASIYSATISSTASSTDTAALTLGTVDVDKVMMGFEVLHEAWASIVQIIIAIPVLAVQMSWACVAPIVVSIICLAATLPIANKVGLAQKNWNAAVQDRISLTASVLGQLREVRILGIGSYASFLIQNLRAAEIKQSHRFRWLLTCILTLSQGTVVLGPFSTFALYTVVLKLTGDSTVLAAQAFTSLSLVSLIANPFGALVQALPSLAAGMTSISRIETYILQASQVDQNVNAVQPFDKMSKSPRSISTLPGDDSNGLAIFVEKGTFGWKSGTEVIKDASFQVPEGSLTVLCGPVAAGKSTMMLALLGAVPVSAGRVELKAPRVSFCAQKPWLVSGSLRHNIICGANFDGTWYQEVVHACALEDDLKQFADGDCHDVGNEGSNLSGGQRQRVALARAVYARTSLMLLDDPFSGLDNASMQHILQNVFLPGGLVRRHNITVVLATNSRDVILHADRILAVKSDGTISEQPTIDEADDHIAKSDSTTDIDAADEPEPRDSRLSSHQQQDPGSAMVEEQADAQRKTGKWKVYSFYMQATGYINSTVFIFLCLSCATLFQISTVWVQIWSDESTAGKSRPLGYYLGIYAVFCFLSLAMLFAVAWTLMVRMVSRSGIRLHNSVLHAVFNAPVSFFDTIDNGVTLNRFNQDLQLVDYNLPLAGVNTCLFIAICSVQAIIMSVATKYMAAVIPLCLAAIYFIQNFYLRTSRQLRLLDIEAKAPLYTNFKETIHGMTTIRAFGGDFGLFLQRENLRLLDASQQPIFLLYTVQRWLSLTLDLLVTVMAIVLIIIAVEVKSGISGSDIGVALVNLTSFNQYLTQAVRYWASMETSLGAISRIQEFSTETPVSQGANFSKPENPEKHQQGLEAGHEIVFRDATAVYKLADSASTIHSQSIAKKALSSINITVPSGAKIAITGRSGSGKSTLVSALFRILPLSSGMISIDGVDITTMDQGNLQSRLSAITQSVFFFTGLTLRDNLDPVTIASNESEQSDPAHQRNNYEPVMIEILTDLGLWKEVGERGGLDAKFEADSWSAGQLQLLSLARAIIKSRRLRAHPGSGWKILVLDEATSSIDPVTASLMRKYFNSEFSDYTILAIVHKFDYVVEDMDRMIVLDHGEVIQDGAPADVLRIFESGNKAS